MKNKKGFSLIELMVVIVLFSLIVFVLIAVFSSTQTAFRNGVTQSGVLEDGRAAMDLMMSDLKELAPSGNAGVTYFTIENKDGTTYVTNSPCGVTLCITNYPQYSLLAQLPPAQITPVARTNILENFFILSRRNLNGHDSWVGTGYAVFNTTNNVAPAYSLYRFSTNCSVHAAGAPQSLFYFSFSNFLAAPYLYSHLIDGVVDLRVRAYDSSGYVMSTNYPNVFTNIMAFQGQPVSDFSSLFVSNALPAAVEVEMGVLENRALQRAQSRNPALTLSPATWNEPWQSVPEWSYLQNSIGRLQVFRQRTIIPITP